MSAEFEVTADLGQIEGVLERLIEAGRILALDSNLIEEISASGVRAFTALCLVCPQEPVTVRLGKHKFELHLTLAFPGNQAEPPAGMASALFEPPARRTEFRNEDSKSLWTVVWDI